MIWACAIGIATHTGDCTYDVVSALMQCTITVDCSSPLIISMLRAKVHQHDVLYDNFTAVCCAIACKSDTETYRHINPIRPGPCKIGRPRPIDVFHDGILSFQPIFMKNARK